MNKPGITIRVHVNGDAELEQLPLDTLELNYDREAQLLHQWLRTSLPSGTYQRLKDIILSEQ